MYKKPIIVFEGIEGSGKSAHIRNVANYLKKKRINFIKIREPGGSPNSEKIRRLIKSDEGLGKKVELLQPENDKLNNLCTGSFDISISVATIEHVINPYIVLDELYRVTKKDGVLICSVPNYAYIKHIVSLLLGRQPKTGTNLDVKYWRNDGWDGMHLHTFTKSSFNTLLVDCGWKPIKWLGCGEKFNWTGLGYIRRNFPGRWSGELIVKCKKI